MIRLNKVRRSFSGLHVTTFVGSRLSSLNTRGIAGSFEILLKVTTRWFIYLANSEFSEELWPNQSNFILKRKIRSKYMLFPTVMAKVTTCETCT